jgi:UDP-4-amino-4-deoxy-L-arabinose-oxoglutarate aminotransferase
VALRALEIGPGDEVITPSLTWVSTVNLIVLAGATPVFVDVDRDTLMTTPDRIAAALTARTRAIIPVHYAGAPADIDAIRSVAAARGIPVLEDAAHAAGAWYKERPVGRDGTAIFSFHPIKNLTTGEGGMVCSDDARFLDRVRRLKFHGLGVDAFDRQTQGRSPQAEVHEPGYKYNLTDMAAALGISQLARLDAMNDRRRELATLYRQRLAAVPEIVPLAEPSYPARHAWHLFIVRVNTREGQPDRDRFMEELKRRNIGTGLHFRAVHLQKYYVEARGMRRGMLPNTEWNSDRICSLPLFPDMTPADVDDVVSAIRDVLAAPR